MASFASVLETYQRRAAAQNARTGAFARGVAWVDGQIVPIAEARIPLLDQGFLHSDLTYDVPGVWDGRFFRLDDHLDRLQASCGKMRLRFPLARAELRETLIAMVAKSGIRDAYVEIIITRGLSFIREKSAEEAVNNLYCFVVPFIWIQELAQQDRGASAIVTRTVRRTPTSAMDPTVKNFQWGDFTRGLLEAGDRGAIYPILPDADGNLTEGSGFNVFVVSGGRLFTPRRGVLEGVTRKTVFEICQARGLAIEVDEVPIAGLYDCDEIFFSSTAGGIMPITTLDGRPVGGGQVGPITRAIWESYWDLHTDPVLSFPIEYAD